MIRPAAFDDIPEIARLGAMFHEQAGWSEIDYSVADCAASLAELVGCDNFLCFVAEQRGIVGMAAGIICPVYFNHGHLSGEEMFWWVSPEAPQSTGLRLLEALEEGARGAGCQTWQMKALDRLNGDRMTRLYERRGYRASERLFIKEL